MTSEIDRFDQISSELKEAFDSGRVLKVAQKAIEVYDEGVKVFFKGPGFENKFKGVAMAAGAPAGLPLFVLASIGGVIISKVATEIDSRKGRK